MEEYFNAKRADLDKVHQMIVYAPIPIGVADARKVYVGAIKDRTD